MKLEITQEAFKAAIAKSSTAVAGKPTLPVLGNLHLLAQGGKLRLAGTNLEVGVVTWIDTKITEEGQVTLPAKLLADVVGGLPSDKVKLTLNERTMTVKIECGKFTSNIKGIEGEEFPTIPTPPEDDDSAVLPAEVLHSAIEQVAMAAATDDSRPVLAGVYLRLKDTKIMMAAADGFRLAVRYIALPEPVKRNGEMLVPAKAMEVIGKVIGKEGSVRVASTLAGSHVFFVTEGTYVVSRQIDGKFPDVERIIPSSYTTRGLLDVGEMGKAGKLASYFAAASQNNIKFVMKPGAKDAPGSVIISANAAEVGDNTGEVEGVVQGESNQIALNVKYVAEMLGVIGSEQVAFEMQSPSSPAVFKPVGVEGYTHVVMPMSLRG
jgi:DNA polymerase-3 subunit beta